MTQRRPYNPNTKYGRRKIREQAGYNIGQYTPEQKADYENTKAVFWVIIIVVLIIAFFVAVASGNGEGFLKWMSR